VQPSGVARVIRAVPMALDSARRCAADRTSWFDSPRHGHGSERSHEPASPEGPLERFRPFMPSLFLTDLPRMDLLWPTATFDMADTRPGVQDTVLRVLHWLCPWQANRRLALFPSGDCSGSPVGAGPRRWILGGPAVLIEAPSAPQSAGDSRLLGPRAPWLSTGI
jgi:hypothetical protein